METDISDILAAVSVPQRQAPRALDLQALTRAWVNERTSPELLPHPSALVDRTVERIKSKIESIEHLTGTMDPAANFTLVIYQTELERFKFLLRSLLRARIAKIDKYPLHTRALALSTPELLSNLEQQYLQSHQALLSSHYRTSFLSSFPIQLQKLDDTQGGISMVDQPDEETAVFCRVLRDAGTVEVYGETNSSDVELRRGDVWLLRWRAVRVAVERGDVELM